MVPKVKRNSSKIQALVPISTKPDKFRTSPNKLQNNSKNKGIKATTLQIREKYKIKIFLDEFCRKEELKTISASTIGLIIKKNNMFW